MNTLLRKKNFDSQRVRTRLLTTVVLLSLAFVVVAARAFLLHLNDNSKLERLTQTQYHRKVVVAPKRGTILDRNGDTLAIDLKVESVYAMPHKISQTKEFTTQLAKVLSMDENKIGDKIADKKKKFVWIKRRISEEEEQKLKTIKLEGFGTLPEYKRFYPNGNLAANLLGAVGYDADALGGLELQLDEILKSQEPPILIEQDAKGRSYAPYALAGIEHPKGVVLSIDKTIQYIAEKELQSAVEKSKAKGGVALVVEVDTGAILAMAVRPTFDPNEYYRFNPKDWRNRSVTDVYEPGSIFKAFTAAAALESEVISPETKINCENGKMRVGNFTINDHHGYGLLSLPDIIKYSSNICSYKIAQKVGKKRFFDFLHAMGFGSKTGIEAPGELGGIMASEKRVQALQLGTIGFGQGISVTPLQIAMAYATLANGGQRMKPLLIREILDSEGKTLKHNEPKIVSQVLSEKNARQTIDLLKTVLETGGTGTQAQLEGYTSAGKTGTAQKVVEGQKGYAKNKYVASYVGLAPTEQPRLVVLVSIDEPQGAYYGGIVSAPVFKRVMEQSLAYLKVPPSQGKDPVSQVAQAKSSPSTKPPQEKIKTKREESPEANEETGAAVAIVVEDAEAIPDLTGLSVREALRKAQAKNLKLEIRGSGICHTQDPSPGKSISNHTSILLECSPPI